MRITALFLAAAVSGFIPAFARCRRCTGHIGIDSRPPHAKTFSDAERTQIEEIVKDYLVKTNPEILIAVSNELRKREQANSQVKAEKAIGESKDQIYNNPDTPVSGDPKGDVTIVEFFDYNCHYCKGAEDGIEKLLKDDKKVKFVYKEFPILGPQSVVAAKAALAANKQGKYVAMHNALMNLKNPLSDDLIYSTAKSSGLDVDKLKKDMNDPAIAKMIDDSTKLGTQSASAARRCSSSTIRLPPACCRTISSRKS